MTAVLAIGLMSGTSLDGIDAALIETDGRDHVRPLAFHGAAYADADRALLAEAARLALTMPRPGAEPVIARAEARLTALHAVAVDALLAQAGRSADEIAVIGFHGQTIAHRPDRGWTWQIGDGARLAEATGIAVVNDLRSADVAAGGQGAPLLPVYHRALCASLPRPIAVLNLGGVGNVTWIGEGDELIAFDTGPANGLIDDWVAQANGARFDAGGALAAQGRVDATILDAMLDNPWFDLPPPKSLDRGDFDLGPVRGLAAADGAATLTRFTAETVALALRLLPEPARRLIVAGGGRHNPTLMAMLADACGLPAEPIEAIGWNGDATEAEGFAYMAVRTLAGLPISFPGTTGAPHPLSGGVLRRPRERAA
ncbi:anhydro-N-acetylmuramic acid kinase [Sphingomonas nostoxanthinifaciens]|uniref:anhydro-N-acetylmuramic acid kinase n=1 Tax=Sphingomonas nostoxanthinifaciens TaxID=2872652 RepID=UPI001CC1E5B0|nr:anhydro-N-acetylmuramic acid kinase [Sphingomonas nostoxanthinifaciens]UAK26333.1 anhydro-N-acetylmuramic acid kinase [Sphingomonas nostoxanthinifaciens]